ncbi:MAG: flagellar export chaperone FliS [Gemmatimonadetes bacterium]|nr:flagellar export chaperone FliS [Gemmatimonadota bacterium]
MPLPANAQAYREMEVLSSSPARLVVITFDATLSALTRARTGVTMGNLAVTLPALDRSRLLLGDLLAALDRERGGDLADRLASVYAFTLGELSALGVHPDLGRLDRIISMLRQLRDAFAEVAQAKPEHVAVA